MAAAVTQVGSGPSRRRRHIRPDRASRGSHSPGSHYCGILKSLLDVYMVWTPSNHGGHLIFDTHIRLAERALTI